MRNFKLLLIGSLVIMTISCKKDEETSKKDLLCGKDWVLVAETVSPAFNYNGTLITDLYAQMADCEQDNIGKFNTNGTYTFEEGVSKCDPSDPQVWDTGTWVFSSDETVLVLTSSTSGIQNSEIQELTSSKLVVTYEVILDVTYTITDTYQKM